MTDERTSDRRRAYLSFAAAALLFAGELTLYFLFHPAPLIQVASALAVAIPLWLGGYFAAGEHPERQERIMRTVLFVIFALYVLMLLNFTIFDDYFGRTKTTVRDVKYIRVIRSEDNTLSVRIYADGFLYKMARNIVGAVVKVGRGRMTVDEFKNIFDGRDRNAAPPPAPALGLCLSEVYY